MSDNNIWNIIIIIIIVVVVVVVVIVVVVVVQWKTIRNKQVEKVIVN